MITTNTYVVTGTKAKRGKQGKAITKIKQELEIKEDKKTKTNK